MNRKNIPQLGRPSIAGLALLRSRAMVKLTWLASAGQAFTATHGRYQITLTQNPIVKIWFAIIFDTRQYDTVACMQDADPNVLRAELARQIADLDILEGN